jgi:endonuclease YncB( thermonuclease family)
LLDVPAFAFGDPLRNLMLLALAGAGIGVGIVMFEWPAGPVGPVPALSGAGGAALQLVVAEPQSVAVVDGGTLRLHDTVVQLHGVAAPARGRNCPNGQGAGYDCGAAASAALADLVRGRPVTCRLAGHDGAGLAQGVCEARGAEINRALVASGWARADGPALREAEAAARAGQVGLWRNGANPGF